MIVQCATEYQPHTPQGETLEEWLAWAQTDLDASIAKGGTPEEMERLIGARTAILTLREWV